MHERAPAASIERSGQEGSTGTATRFVWPPRSAPPAGMPRTTPRKEHRPEDRPIDQPAGALLGHHRVRSLVELVGDIEIAWFGVVRRSFAARARDEGWAPDGADAYCGRCGETVGPHEADGMDAPGGPQCPACRAKRLAWDRFVRVGEYRGILRDAVQDLKYTAW